MSNYNEFTKQLEIRNLVSDLKMAIEDIESIDEKIETLNYVKSQLHEISPFKNEPIDCVTWAKNNTVFANDYNPNNVAPPEMQLLYISILEDGYTQPIVTMDNENNTREVIDGFHRHKVAKEYQDIKNRLQDYLPVVSINKLREEKSDRIAATIRHNRARGKHSVTGMSDIVLELKRRNWSDAKISQQLGMDKDEVLRLTQISGLVELFSDSEFSQAWEIESETNN